MNFGARFVSVPSLKNQNNQIRRNHGNPDCHRLQHERERQTDHPRRQGTRSGIRRRWRQPQRVEFQGTTYVDLLRSRSVVKIFDLFVFAKVPRPPVSSTPDLASHESGIAKKAGFFSGIQDFFLKFNFSGKTQQTENFDRKRTQPVPASPIRPRGGGVPPRRQAGVQHEPDPEGGQDGRGP